MKNRKDMNIDAKKGEVVIYKAKSGGIRLDVKLEKETVWLTQKQLAGLFLTERSVITKHLNNIFQTRELDEKSNVQKMHIPCQYVPFWNTLIPAYRRKRSAGKGYDDKDNYEFVERLKTENRMLYLIAKQ